jgi:hypothetical protein
MSISNMQRSHQEATSARPLDRGPYTDEARATLGTKMENADEMMMEQVSSILEGHVNADESGEIELDLQVRLRSPMKIKLSY